MLPLPGLLLAMSRVSSQKRTLPVHTGYGEDRDEARNWTKGLGRCPPLRLALRSCPARQLFTGMEGTGAGAGEGVRGNGEEGGYSLMAPVYVGWVRSLGTFL